MDSKIKDLWVVEYSVSQQCFHVDTLGDSINNNQFICVNQRPVDYLIIAICDTYEQAHGFINLFQARYHLPSNN